MSQVPTPSDTEKTARQLRQLKGVVAALFALLVLGTTLVFWVRRQAQPVCILLDGKAVANAPSISAAEGLLHEAEQALTHHAYPESSIVRLQTVQFERLNGAVPMDADRDAQAKLCRKLRLHVRAYAITVDGTPAVALPTDKTASDTLHAVKEHFASLPPAADIVGEPEFVEKVAVTPEAVDVSLAYGTAQQAAPLFWTAAPGKTYTVKRGDTGLSIAIRQHVHLSRLRDSNPGVNLDRLKVGDTLSVQKGAARLSVRVRKQFSRDEPVMNGVPAAEAGLRRVTYRVTFVKRCGRQARRGKHCRHRTAPCPRRIVGECPRPGKTPPRPSPPAGSASAERGG